MYSWEIDNLLKLKGFLLTHKEYFDVLMSSPQIIRVSYNSFTNKFEIWTEDRCYWQFDVCYEPELEKKLKI